MASRTTPYDLYNPPASEQYIKIWVRANGIRVPAWEQYPLSLLKAYSKRIKRFRRFQGSIVSYTIDLAMSPAGVRSVGITTLLQWFLQQLPARGFSPNYRGLRQLPDNVCANTTIEHLCRLYEAAVLLELDEHLVVIPNVLKAIRQKISSTPCTARDIAAIHAIIANREPKILSMVLHNTVDFVDENHYPEAQFREIQDLRRSNPQINAEMKKIKVGKMRRIQKEVQQAAHGNRQQAISRRARQQERN